jgi:prolyl-tRNA synthetase
MPRKPVFWSQTFIPTLRDIPAGTLSAAHKLLIRAGYWRPAGYLPLGVRALARMQAIAREELAALGAEELHFPAAGAVPAMHELARAAGHSPRLWYRVAAHRTDDIGLDIFAHNSPDAAASIHRILQRCGVDVLPNAPDGAPPIDDPEGDLQPEAFATPDCGTIAEVAAFTGRPATAQMKSLVMVADGQPTLALVRGDHHLSRPKLGQILHAEDIRPATTPQIQDWFGADPGSLGPVGISNLRIFADAALLGRRNMISGANRTGYHLRNVAPSRDFTAEFYDLRDGETTGALQTAATHYIGLPACGLDFGAILRLVAERDADADGLRLPAAVAPYDVVITPVNNAELALRDAATAILDQCEQQGINALYDDRDERPGVKFKDADLIGVPWRMTIGTKKLALGQLELTERKSHSTQDVALTDAAVSLAAKIGDQ